MLSPLLKIQNAGKKMHLTCFSWHINVVACAVCKKDIFTLYIFQAGLAAVQLLKLWGRKCTYISDMNFFFKIVKSVIFCVASYLFSCFSFLRVIFYCTLWFRLFTDGWRVHFLYISCKSSVQTNMRLSWMITPLPRMSFVLMYSVILEMPAILNTPTADQFRLSSSPSTSNFEHK